MKKVFLSLLVCSLLVSSFSSCSKFEETSESSTISDSSSSESSNVSEEASEEEYQLFDFSALSKEELSQYITLGEYKGLESEKVVVEVKDKDIEDAISQILLTYSEQAEVKDRGAKEGDTVTIDYAGYMNGELFDGGSATDQSLTIGEGKFIDGFEDGIIGVKTGEKVSINISFPEDYGKEELNGKPVTFEITVKKIVETVIPPLSEEIIKEYTDDKATTEEEFRAFLKDELFESFTREENNLSEGKYWDKVVANATVIKYPDGIVDEYVQMYLDYYSQYAALYGITLEEFLGTTVDEFKKSQAKTAEEMYKEQMVLYAAINAENYDTTIDDEKYKAWLEELALLMGSSIEAIAEKYSVETLQSTYVHDTFIDYLYATRTEIEPKEESSESAESTESNESAESTDSNESETGSTESSDSKSE